MSASIHDIGEEYTLVLLDGRRLAPQGSGSAVNLNAIPMSAVERVEILTDGASALYGSDAIAGVINIVLKSQVSETSLTRDTAFQMEASGLPNTFVPGRNLLFLGFAATLAYRRGASVLVGGMCETDYSGYPDCRDNTLKALQVALSLGMDGPMVVETPLMWLDKAATWALAQQLGEQPDRIDFLDARKLQHVVAYEAVKVLSAPAFGLLVVGGQAGFRKTAAL